MFGNHTRQHGLSGVMLLTGPDGKMYNIRISNVAVELTSQRDVIEESRYDGRVTVSYPVTTTTTLDMTAHMDGMTVTDTKKASSD